MAQTFSKTQLPAPGITAPIPEKTGAFERGLLAGREYADTAMRRLAAWTEEHPGQALLAALAAGFVLGKIFLRRRPRRVIEEPD
jgi:hypothetical protein